MVLFIVASGLLPVAGIEEFSGEVARR